MVEVVVVVGVGVEGGVICWVSVGVIVLVVNIVDVSSL